MFSFKSPLIISWIIIWYVDWNNLSVNIYCSRFIFQSLFSWLVCSIRFRNPALIGKIVRLYFFFSMCSIWIHRIPIHFILTALVCRGKRKCCRLTVVFMHVRTDHCFGSFSLCCVCVCVPVCSNGIFFGSSDSCTSF